LKGPGSKLVGGGGAKAPPSREEGEPEGGEAQEGTGRWCGVTLVLDCNGFPGGDKP
jgi:hypothetical protein